VKKAFSIFGWPIVGMPTIIRWSTVQFIDGLQLSYDPEIGDHYEANGSTEVAWENQAQMLVADITGPHPAWGAQPWEALWLDQMNNVYPDSALQWAENGETLQRMLGYDREESIDTYDRPWGWWRTAA
jgi:hypothetical protein